MPDLFWIRYEKELVSSVGLELTSFSSNTSCQQRCVKQCAAPRETAKTNTAVNSAISNSFSSQSLTDAHLDLWNNTARHETADEVGELSYGHESSWFVETDIAVEFSKCIFCSSTI